MYREQCKHESLDKTILKNQEQNQKKNRLLESSSLIKVAAFVFFYQDISIFMYIKCLVQKSFIDASLTDTSELFVLLFSYSV